MPTREALHELTDQLPDDALEAAGRSLAKLSDPVLRAFLTAPEDDEPLSNEERTLLDRRIASYRAGNFVDHERSSVA